MQAAQTTYHTVFMPVKQLSITLSNLISFQMDCEMTLLLLAQTSTPHVERVKPVPVQLLPAWNKATAHAVIEQCLVRYICDFGIPRKWQTGKNSLCK
jgi:hypothetical protein